MTLYQENIISQFLWIPRMLILYTIKEWSNELFLKIFFLLKKWDSHKRENAIFEIRELYSQELTIRGMKKLLLLHTPFYGRSY